MSLPEVHLVGGTCAEALRLAPVALAMRVQGGSPRSCWPAAPTRPP